MSFISVSFRLLPTRPQNPLKSSRERRPHYWRSALHSPQEPVKPRFRRDEPTPQTSFFPENAAPANSPPTTPNERVLQQVRQTMSRLGVQQHPQTPPPPTYAPIDISGVNPFSALLGAAGAAAISYAAWNVLVFVATFSAEHPLDAQIYVVQRLGAIVRTALVCLLALASGISGVTSLGLFLLSARTAYGKISGEFGTSKQQGVNTETH